MRKQVGCTPTSSLGEILGHMCICCMAIPTPHIISIIWPSLAYDCPHLCEPFTPFCLPSPSFSLCHPKCQRILIALIHCISAQSRKGEDQFEFYLTSGLGVSQNKIPKETKC